MVVVQKKELNDGKFHPFVSINGRRLKMNPTAANPQFIGHAMGVTPCRTFSCRMNANLLP